MFNKFIKKTPSKIYADYASTTPTRPEVIKAMTPFLTENFFNPAAIYGRGVKARQSLEEARRISARALGSRWEEIIFTGSGTESDNLALIGIFKVAKAIVSKPHIITSNIEHPAVTETLAELEKWGAEVTYLPVNEAGLISSKQVAEALRESTVLVTVMSANNEIGTIQPIKAIARIIKDWRRKQKTVYPYFHTDASQAPNYLSVKAETLGVDLMTLDGSKIYGPKGVGALYVKHGVRILPVLFGGGQEQGLRPGTENLAPIVGFAKALELSQTEREAESQRLLVLRDRIINELLNTFPEASLNGDAKNRLPNNINLCFPSIDAEFAVIKLDSLGVECSYATACRTYKSESGSEVVRTLGKTNCESSSLRLTLGRHTTESEVREIIRTVSQVIKDLSQ